MNKKIALVLAWCATVSFAACSEGVDRDLNEPCVDGAKRCADSDIQVCLNDHWYFESKCHGNTPICDPQTFTCTNKPVVNECQGSEKKCAENAVWTCVGGAWTKTAACTPQQTCNPTTFACDDNANPDIACDKNGEKLALGATYCGDDKTLYTCVEKDGSAVFETKTCEGDTPVCGMNGETAACVAGSNVKCTKEGDETEYDLGATYCGDDTTLYTCVEKDGSAVFEPTTCEGVTPVCGLTDGVADCIASESVECTLGSSYCDDNGKLHTCVEQEDGTTAFVSSDCPADLPVCALDEGACRAYRTCVVEGASTVVPHNGKTCVGNVVRLCDDGELADVTDCAASGKVCDSATRTCIDKAPENCTVDSTTIANGATACIGIEKVTCTNGTTTNEACTTTVANASPTCDMVDAAATCGFACNDGFKLSDDGSSCIKVAVFDDVVTIRKAYDSFVDSKTCRAPVIGNTAKSANVNLVGVVTALHSEGFYVQDTTGGIFVSCKDKACLKYADKANVAIGDNVKVTSDGIGHFYCDLRIQALKTPVSVEKTTSNETVEPELVLVEDIAQNGAKNLNLGKLVNVFSLEALSLDKHGNWKVTQEGDEINVAPLLIGQSILKTAMNVGKAYAITGIGFYEYGEVRLAPRMIDDIVEECVNGSYLCDPETNEYKKCLWGQWMNAEPCSKFNFTASGGSNANATAYACNAKNNGCIITKCENEYKPTVNGLACEKIGTTCTEDDLKCISESEYSICMSGTWYNDTTVPGQKCEGDKLVCIAPATCVDGQWYTCDAATGNTNTGTNCNTNADGKTACGASLNECVEPSAPPVPTGGLIISEVANINNSKNHPVKFIEVYNATDAAVSIDGCQLIVHAKTKSYTLKMGGNLEAGKTYIYCNDYANEAETDADLKAKCSKVFIDSDHMGGMTTKRAIELQCDGKTLDITGKKGVEYSHKTNIIRKCGITSGVTDPNVGAQPADWNSSDATIEGLKTTLGTHEVVCKE